MGRRPWALALVTAGLSIAAIASPGLRAGVAKASSHREAPLTAADPQIDSLYVIKGGVTTNLVANGVAAPSDVGAASMPNYAALRSEAVSTFDGGQAKSLAGQAADPFFLDLRVFDLLYGANLKETGHNTLAGFNVNTIVLQVPKTEVVANGDAT